MSENNIKIGLREGEKEREYSHVGITYLTQKTGHLKPVVLT